MIITKRMKEPTNQSNPWRHPLPLSEANCSSVLLHLRTRAQQGPAAPDWEVQPSVCTLTPTGLTLAETWRGPLDGLRGPGLSILSLLPLISWGDLGPKAVGTWVWGAEGTAMEQCGGSHAG